MDKKGKNTTPAVLLYYEDLLQGTDYMDDAEFGQYVRLLCRQNVNGHMSQDYLRRIHMEELYPCVAEKFIEDEDGDIYNERMEFEIQRRIDYSESRKRNRSGAKRDTKGHMSKDVSEHMSDDMETETETGTETPNKKEEIEQIVSYLNNKLGTGYRASSKATSKRINARLNEGYSLDDFIAVIDKKCDDWLGDTKMAQYLTPDTLFGTKFEKYLEQARMKKSTGNAFLDMAMGVMT